MAKWPWTRPGSPGRAPVAALCQDRWCPAPGSATDPHAAPGGGGLPASHHQLPLPPLSARSRGDRLARRPRPPEHPPTGTACRSASSTGTPLSRSARSPASPQPPTRSVRSLRLTTTPLADGEAAVSPAGPAGWLSRLAFPPQWGGCQRPPRMPASLTGAQNLQFGYGKGTQGRR